MIAVRFHGRGGQGVVTTAELMSVAAFSEGRHAQAFPTFGSERTGAPVTAYCRFDDAPIRSHEPIGEPDSLVVQDPTLLHVVPVLDGATPRTSVLVNTSRPAADLGIVGLDLAQVTTVAATDLARRYIGRPMPGCALLGAWSAMTGLIGLDALLAAIRSRFTDALAEANVATAVAGHEAVALAGGSRVRA